MPTQHNNQQTNQDNNQQQQNNNEKQQSPRSPQNTTQATTTNKKQQQNRQKHSQQPQQQQQQQQLPQQSTIASTKRPGVAGGLGRADPRSMQLSSVSTSALSTASFPGDSSSTFVSASPIPSPPSPPPIRHLPTLPHLPQLAQPLPPPPPPQSPQSPQSHQHQHQHQQTRAPRSPQPAHTAAAATDIINNEDVSDEYKLLLSPMFAAMSKITEHLFLTGVGGMTRTNFRRNHIDFVVNITTEAPFWENTESMRLPLEDDVGANILPYLDTAVDRIHDAIVRRGAHVLVHCIAGVSRSATVVMAYLMKYKRMDLKTAFNYCYNLRPIIRPNNGFMQQLISYELQLFGRNSVWMTDTEVEGTQVRVPQFFIDEHPRLVLLEIMRVRAMTKQPQGPTGSPPPNQQQSPPPPGSPGGHQAT